MIIVQITGGLGNQLFQYATARALSLRHATPLGIDTRVYQGDASRRFGLNHFHIHAVNCDGSSVTACHLPPPQKNLIAFVRWQLTHGRSVRYFRERGLGFDPAVFTLGPQTYLHGYWQSEQYFLGAQEVLRQELKLQTPPSPENAEWLREITSHYSVSVHVRRGDYVSDTKAGRVHGTCSPQYYQQAADLLRSKLGDNLTFYVFSDEPNWAAENIVLPLTTRYVRHNDDLRNYEDLRLMSACNHHIVANSSFSWWGAWLASNPQKLVIAPARWFRDPKKDDRDLVPTGWLRV